MPRTAVWCGKVNANQTLVGDGDRLVLASATGSRQPRHHMSVRVPCSCGWLNAMLALDAQDEGLRTSIGRTVEPQPRPPTTFSMRRASRESVGTERRLTSRQGRWIRPSFQSSEADAYVVSVNRRHPLAEQRARQMFVRLWKALMNAATLSLVANALLALPNPFGT